MKYYLQIVKDNVSILVDSDVGYYHQFKIDDVIEVVMNDELQLGFQTQHLGISLNIRDLIVTDIVGKEIYNAKGNDQKTQVKLNGFASVIYYITITRGIEKITKKVVID